MANDTAADATGANLARHGKVSYMQVPALDVERSASFYEAIFGWRVRRDGNAAHLGFEDASGELIGAFVTHVAPVGDGGVLPYIYVTRIEETARQIEANGGAIVRTVYPEGSLLVATFRDPAGNTVGIWQDGAR